MLRPALANQPFAAARIARFYDCFPFQADVPWYLALVRRAGPRVLELACGTGRLLLPLARAGSRVVGLDASSAMLAICAGKLAGEEPEARRRVRLVEGAMQDFHLDDEFDLATVAVKSFGYLQSPDDQLAALGAFARHLRPGGLLALDLLHPTPDWLGERPGSVRQDVCGTTAGGETVMRTEAVVSVDLAAQVKVIRSAYELIQADGSVTKDVVEWPFRYTFRYEAEHLLERAAFDVAAVQGDYDGRPFSSDSANLLIVARRR
jgi:ubiquinone/menaquinone biosynthesis C-methylase UbiE